MSVASSRVRNLIFLCFALCCNVSAVAPSPAKPPQSDGEFCKTHQVSGFAGGALVKVDAKSYAKHNELTKDRCEQTASPAALADVDVVRQFYSDRTIRTFSPAHGTQVEYYAADGRAFLWYPGNPVILAGTWVANEGPQRVIADGPDGQPMIDEYRAAYMCYTYDKAGRNPVTGSTAKKECQPYSRAKAVFRESKKGDILGLSTRETVPFVLAKDDTTLAALVKQKR